MRRQVPPDHASPALRDRPRRRSGPDVSRVPECSGIRCDATDLVDDLLERDPRDMRIASFMQLPERRHERLALRDGGDV